MDPKLYFNAAAEILWRFEHRADLDAGFPAPLRRISILREGRRPQAKV